MAVASASAWLIIDISIDSSQGIYQNRFWAVAVRLFFFILITYGATSFVLSRRKYQQLSNYIIHDLKSPLTNILMGLQTVKDLDKTLSDKTLQMLDVSIVSSKRMFTLINSINDLWKIEDGKLKPNLEDVNIRKLINLCTEEISMWTEKNNVSIIHCIETNREFVRTDMQLISRILVNLLSNSIKVSPKDSTIKICVKDTSTNTVYFSIKDFGPGFELANTPKLSGELQKLKLTKIQERSTGLGLEFCLLAIKMLHGKIWFERNNDQTISSFEIPT